MKNISNKNLILKGKKVLLRVDLNVPIKNGAITETSRIEKIIPTIKLLLEKQAKIIIISHIGRPKGKVVPGMSLEPISKILAYKDQSKGFGLFATSGKLTSFLGPILVSTLTFVSGSQRIGFSAAIFLLIIGLILLFRIKNID